jgi:alkylation response protein AidB-like acyl-CoA dehydrogenase
LSRAPLPRANVALIARQIEAIAPLAVLRAGSEAFAAASPDVIEAILSEADRFAADRLDPLNAAEGRAAPRLQDGRVTLSAEHRSAWADYAAGGWIGLDLSPAAEGQGLPLVLAVAVQEILDRSCAAFGMLSVSTRSAAKLIEPWAPAELAMQWLPALAAGRWTGTICISEVDAGSDVGRMRTTATPDEDGAWRVTGEKNWISFGDHDAAERIGHCLLARTPGARGLSLFLVPDRIDGGGNGVFTRRLEDKLGLHLSPTCALGFERSRAWLLGEEGSVANMGHGRAASPSWGIRQHWRNAY